jgi:primosomal protein N' (replication factor Y)
VFSPLEDTGLVIVDEEHDESYIQRENPGYDARKGAWIRARTESCLLVYGSSIPSVEAFYQARKRGYVLRLQGGGPVKKAEILEARAEESVFSQKLVRIIEKNLKKRNRVLLFFNRRGYASYLICSRCRFIPRCVRCDVALRYHKKEGKLICHYCGHSALKLDACPNCGSRLRLGRTFGIEVIEEELLRKFPESRVVCFDSDAVKSKKDQERILSRFGKKRIDILIGTQLLAHQKNLSPVPLVVGMYPEGLLTLPDYRASQKTFQILCQMRRFLSRDQSSQLVIQTSVPDQYSIRSAAQGDYLSFFRQEIKNRRMMNYPPFSHAVEILFQSGNMRSLARETRKFTSLAKSSSQKIDIFGPAFASVARLRGKFRVQVILKSKRRKNLEAVLRESLSQVKCKKSVFFFD